MFVYFLTMRKNRYEIRNESFFDHIQSEEKLPVVNFSPLDSDLVWYLTDVGVLLCERSDHSVNSRRTEDCV